MVGCVHVQACACVDRSTHVWAHVGMCMCACLCVHMCFLCMFMHMKVHVCVCVSAVSFPMPPIEGAVHATRGSLRCRPSRGQVMWRQVGLLPRGSG